MKRRIREAVFLGLLLVGSLLFRPQGETPIRQSRFLLDTVVTITAYGPNARTALPKAWAVLGRLSRELAPYRRGSELWRLNHTHGWITVTPRFYRLLRLSLRLARESGGAFDPTVWPLTETWGFTAPPGRTLRPRWPGRAAVRAARRLVGYAGLELGPDDRVRWREPGMGFDSGGIAKGYAADLAAEALRRAGVRSALVDVGESSLVALGPKPNGKSWRIAVERPRGGGFAGFLELRSGGLGTSGDYREFFFHRGRRYSHIFNPRTGYPARGLSAVTVLGPDGARADASGTAAFVLGPGRAAGFLRRQGEEGILWLANGRVRRVGGLVLRPLPGS